MSKATIVKADNNLKPHGHKYWAQNQPDYVVPRQRVYKCVGFIPDTGSYAFQDVREKNVIVFRSTHQLSTNGFVPFLYVTEDVPNAAVCP